jgi:N-formylglutamate amidohydrolase
VTEKTFANYIHVYDESEHPILLEMPHSGLVGLKPTDTIPAPLISRIDLNSEEVSRAVGSGCDSSVPEMTGFKSLIEEFKLYGISNDLARIFCDTNRDKEIEKASSLVVKGGKLNDNHHGVIWATTPLNNIDLSLPDDQLIEMLDNGTEKILKEPLTVEEFNALMREVYDPYHAHIQHLHNSITSKHGYCVHVALHSMPPLFVKKLNGAYILGQKAKRGPFNTDDNTLPDIILIHNEYRAANRIVVDVLRYAFESSGLIVEDGKGPFLGGDIGVTSKYGNPLRGINVGIEHVAHDTEPERHLGNPEIDKPKARKLQKAYRSAVEGLLEL